MQHVRVCFSSKATMDSGRNRTMLPKPAIVWLRAASVLLLMASMVLAVGCGSGGYNGGVLTALSSSAATIDAGQSFLVTSQVVGQPTITWTLAGKSCSGASCGTLSSATGNEITYTAPGGLTSQTVVKLTAAAVASQSQSSVTITVNPDPALSGLVQQGTVGTPYTTTLLGAGGTAPLQLSLGTGTLPQGLSFDPATGILSGTPTVAGTSTFTVLIADASSVSSTQTASESIVITDGQGMGPSGALTIQSAPLGAGVVGTAYTATLDATGGTAPYTWSIPSGSLPAGLTLDTTTGSIVGVPTTQGSYGFTAQVQDAAGNLASALFSIPINAASGIPALTLTSPANATVWVAYNGTVGVAGGTMPYSCTITGLPAGLTANGCTISGTPTAAATTTLTVTASDSSSPAVTTTGMVTWTVLPATLSLTLTALPPATVGLPYTGTLSAGGGTAPYTCSILSGTLSAGLSLNGCVVSGTPTTPGSVTLVIQVTDAGSPPQTATGTVTLTVTSSASTLLLTPPPPATVNVPYTGTIGVSGGTAPYACSLASGTLPTGLTLNGCVVSGTPTAVGTSTATMQATDSGWPPNTTTGSVTFTVAPATLSLTLSSLPTGTVGTPYSSTIAVAGGTPPYGCTIIGGALPAGLSLSGCVVSGTPTVAGTVNLGVRVTDTSNPAQSANGAVSLTIAPASLTLTLSTLPNATVGIPYSGTIAVSGGTAPYSCTITSGALPAGLSLNGCVVGGTPTVSGPASFSVLVTDSGSPAQTASEPLTFTVAPAALSLTLSTLPNATAGTLYSQTIGVTGGTAPYTCAILSGTLPSGLTLSGCLVSGTPTVAATVNLTVRATDASNPVESVTGPVGLTVLPAAVPLTLTPPPAATVNVPYTGAIGVSGGTAPYTCTLLSGAPPTGLSLTGCTLSGTPSTPGSATLRIQATDASSPAVNTTGNVTVTVNAPAGSLTITSPPDATAQTPYSKAIGITGGTPPYTCTIMSGSLPAGLTSTGCLISGTPTTVGTSNFSVQVTDTSGPALLGNASLSLTVDPITPLTLTGTLPNAIQNQAYTQTLTAAGGLPPYTYSVTAGALPTGLALNPSTGAISGTPTVPGATSFTITAQDSEATPQTASLPLVLLVTYPTTPYDALLTGPYAFLFQGYDDVSSGVLAYQTATAGSFTADGSGVVSVGEMDSNHQTSSTATNIVQNNNFLGTYTIGADNRGQLTLTPLNADGTAATSATYAISLKAPVSPSTIATEVDMIEADNNNATGTRGSGTILAQDATASTVGMSGRYVFGMTGDAPCLLTCTLNLAAGPAAAVGQFTASGSSIDGSGDANIAATTYQNAALTGSYTAPDANGRMTMTMTMNTENSPLDYPSDYAVYAVNASQAFLLDRHPCQLRAAGGNHAAADAATLRRHRNDGSLHRLRKRCDQSRSGNGIGPRERAQPIHGDDLPWNRKCKWQLQCQQCGYRRNHRSGRCDHRSAARHHWLIGRPVGLRCDNGADHLQRLLQWPWHAAVSTAHTPRDTDRLRARATGLLSQFAGSRLLPRVRIRRTGPPRAPNRRPLHQAHVQRNLRLWHNDSSLSRQHQCLGIHHGQRHSGYGDLHLG